jgi:2-dehydro-3-deoxygluconokinase
VTRFVSIGECLIELRRARPDTFKRAFAGDTLVTAIYLKRTAPDIEVQFVTATGRDRLSGGMRAFWKDEGIDDSLAFSVSGGQPSLYLVEVDKKGERRVIYWRDRSAAKQWLRMLKYNGGAERLAGADFVYLTGMSLAILSDNERAEALELLAELHQRGIRIAFSPHLRPQLWPDMVRARFSVEEAAKFSTILLADIDDGKLLYETDDPRRLLSHFSGRGGAELVLNRGRDGCVVAAGGEVWEVAADGTDPADVAGTDDAFTGAYLAKRLQGTTPRQAALAALEVADRVAMHQGALVSAAISHPDNTGTAASTD